MSRTMNRVDVSGKLSGWIRGSSLRTVQFKRLLGMRGLGMHKLLSPTVSLLWLTKIGNLQVKSMYGSASESINSG
jgi:hypothetical protein